MAEVEVQSLTSTMAFITLFLTMFSIKNCSGQVPLVMWSSEGYSWTPLTPPTAGQILSSGQLVSYLDSALSTAPHNVLLFLQDKLSIEDFTMYGGVYGNKQDSVFLNLESALQASSSPLVLPALSWPAAISVPALFQEGLGIPPIHTDPATLAQRQLNLSESSLFIISLPYNTSGQSKELLRRNDEVIGEVLNIMKAQDVSYTAVYTGLKPSRIIEEDMVEMGRSVGRSLLQAPTSTPTVKPPVVFNNSGDCIIMLWAEKLNVRREWTEMVDLGPQTFNASVNLMGSSCNETEARLVIHYTNVQSLPLSLTFVLRKTFFTVSARNWSLLQEVVLEYNGFTAMFSGNRSIYAPAEYSFHCQNVSNTRDPLLVALNSDEAKFWNLSFTDFQIQGFGVEGGDFSYASDCAGFFTPGIWMGLITSLLMLLVLTYGLHMIMQLSTMDRFDDPKGPAISVPLAD